MTGQEPAGAADPSAGDQKELRRAVVSGAVHSTEMEGGRVSAAAAADLDSYVDGELSAEELVVRVKERLYAAGVPRPVVGD